MNIVVDWTDAGSVRQISSDGRGLLGRPVEFKVIEARDDEDVPGRLVSASAGRREARFAITSDEFSLSWRHLYWVNRALASRNG